MVEIKKVSAQALFPAIKEILDSGASVRITVTGSSMTPFLREGQDSVELIAASWNSFRRGEIVVIADGSGKYILHRVHKRVNHLLYIIGDAQQKAEGPIESRQIVAVVKSVWRGNRHILCSGFLWRTLSSVWMRMLPVRPVLLRLYNGIRR